MFCCLFPISFMFVQQSAYELLISDWTSDVCSSDLPVLEQDRAAAVVAAQLSHLDNDRHEEAGSQDAVQGQHHRADEERRKGQQREDRGNENAPHRQRHAHQRSEEHTSELQSLMRISYAVFCLTTKKQKTTTD